MLRCNCKIAWSAQTNISSLFTHFPICHGVSQAQDVTWCNPVDVFLKIYHQPIFVGITYQTLNFKCTLVNQYSYVLSTFKPSIAFLLLLQMGQH